MYFTPNDGRQPIIVNDTEDIRAYMGDIMNYFDDIVIQGENVLVGLKGHYTGIGRISSKR